MLNYEILKQIIFIFELLIHSSQEAEHRRICHSLQNSRIDTHEWNQTQNAGHTLSHLCTSSGPRNSNFPTHLFRED